MSSIEGLDELKRRLAALGDGASAALGKAVLAGGSVLEGKIKIEMGKQKTGRRYGSHVASAPGEAPAMLTGALINSLHTQLLETSPTQASAQVFTNAEYGRPLEFGSAHIAARPFMRPAVDTNQAKISEAASIILKQAIDEASHA